MNTQRPTNAFSTIDDIAVAGSLFDEIAVFSLDTAGVSRPAYSAIETKTLEYLEQFARRNGLDVWYDAGQNANFCLPGDRNAEAFVVVGSHVDSVPSGGNYDGLAGVIAGLLCLRRARCEKRQFGFPVRVLAMRAEESAWFGPCYIGSKALTGALDPSELLARHKGDGQTLEQHMADIGIDTNDIRNGRPLIDCASIRAYVELHIEQGPLLIGKDIPAAIVSAIRGNIRYQTIRCVGEAGHSGAVPKAYRHDPVLAMADLLVRLDESWSTILNKGDDLVLTSGMVQTDRHSHAMTRIPDQITFSLDIRSQSAQTLDEMQVLLESEMRQVENDRGVFFHKSERLRVEPAQCDPGLIVRLKNAMENVGQEPFVMASGGGHDAAVFAAAGIASAMIFVRNRNGSHNPLEAMALDDFVAATDILYEFLKEPEL